MSVSSEVQPVQTLSPDLTWHVIFRWSCKLAMQMHALRPILIFSSVVVTSKDERLVARLLIRRYVISWWGHQSSLCSLLPWGRYGMWQTKWKATTLSHYCSSLIKLLSKDMTNYSCFFPINVSYAQWNNSFIYIIWLWNHCKGFIKRYCIIYDTFFSHSNR